MIFSYNRIYPFNDFSGNTVHSEVLTHSNFKVVLSLTTTASTKLDFYPEIRKNQLNCTFKRLKLGCLFSFAVSEIEESLPSYGSAIIKSVLGTALKTFDVNTLSKISTWTNRQKKTHRQIFFFSRNIDV